MGYDVVAGDQDPLEEQLGIVDGRAGGDTGPDDDDELDGDEVDDDEVDDDGEEALDADADDVEDIVDADADEDLDDEVAYELGDWAGESRQLVDGLLNNAGIAHVWEAGTLVVRAEHEAEVDAIIDEIDVTTAPALDPDAVKVAYEVHGWTDEQRMGLADALGAEAIAYEWDTTGDLLVLEEDEARVEEVLDALEFPDVDEDAGDEDDGLAAQQVLSDLFVSADRLMHDARDPDGVLTFVDAAAKARSLALPFGFERGVWDEIVARARALSDDFERDVEDDDEITERATDLRNLLRTYV